MPKGVYIHKGNRKGCSISLKTRKKMSEAHKGKKLSVETRKKMSEILIGNKRTLGYKQSEETKKKHSELAKKLGYGKWMKGRSPSLETRQKSRETRRKNGWYKNPEVSKKKISEGHKREKSHFWKGGITPINMAIRNSFEYKLWRKAVFERDNYTCIFCEQRGGELNADHIKPFCDYPELRFAIDNGRTLCIGCHKKTDTWGKNRKKL